VFFLRSCSHAVSFGDNELASRITGREAGQFTDEGAYPPEGESGNSLRAISKAAASTTTSGRSMTIRAVSVTLQLPIGYWIWLTCFGTKEKAHNGRKLGCENHHCNVKLSQYEQFATIGSFSGKEAENI
jgi:hypothetical protein